MIKPYLNRKVILIDRFIDSTIAYQHYGFKINKRVIKELNNFILGNLKPNFTFFHYVPIKRIKKKISGKKNKYDSFSKNFYNKVQNADPILKAVIRTLTGRLDDMNEKTEKIWKELHFLSSIKQELEG